MIGQNQKPKTRREKIHHTFENIGAWVGLLAGIVGVIGVATGEGFPGHTAMFILPILGLFAIAGWAAGWVMGSVVASMFPESVASEGGIACADRTSMPPETDSSQHGIDQEPVQKSAQEYLSELDEWGVRNDIAGDLLYYKEWVENPAVGIFLLSRVRLVETGAISISQLASIAFMAGMLIGAKQAREGSLRTKLPEDYNRRHTEALEWITDESDQGRAGLRADEYLANIRKQERILGISRGALAEAEAKRDTRLAGFLQMAAALGGDPGDVAMSVFRIALLAGARSHIEGYVKEAVR